MMVELSGKDTWVPCREPGVARPEGKGDFVTAKLIGVKCGPAGSQTLRANPVQVCQTHSRLFALKSTLGPQCPMAAAMNLMGLSGTWDVVGPKWDVL